MHHIFREQGQTMMMFQMKSLNLLDMYYLTFLSMCYPVKFLLTKRIWRPLFETAAARDTVNNCLFMTPSILWVLRVRDRCNIIKLTFPF